MDQLRVALKWLKRHHFWLLGALVPLMALGAWWVGAGYLQEQYATATAAINKAFSDQGTLASRTFYPNDNVNAQQRAEIVEQAEAVASVWQQLYDRQREQVLQWPDLGPDFLEYMGDRDFGDPIRNDMRNRYLDYAKTTFSELPKIVGAKEVEGDVQPGGMGESGFGSIRGFGGEGGSIGNMMGMMDDPTLLDDSLVRWHDQMNVKQQLYFAEQPSAIRIWVTQEDLWVYQTLLRAIAATNEAANADRYSNAAVRDIFGLQVGKLAAQESRTKGRIVMREPAAGAGGFGEEGSMGPVGPEGGGYSDGDAGFGERGMEGFGGPGEGFGDGPLTEEQERQVLLTGRYIDGEGKPVVVVAGTEGTGDSGMGDSGMGDPGLGVEYKRLPIRMVLNMDQRWLSYLVAQLANAPLQIEVQEVRINPQSIDTSGGGGGMYGGEGGGGRFGGGNRGFGGEGGFSPGGMGTGEEVAIFERQPHVTPVVIQGTIYIFNQPDPTQLEPEPGGEAGDTSSDFVSTDTF